MIFEKAGVSDTAELTELRTAYLSEDYGGLDADTAARISGSLPDYFRRHIGSDLFVYVCREADKIVGCCFLYISEKPSNPSFISGRTGMVLNVYTLPEYRRKGIAGKLVGMLISDAEELGLDFVELKSTDAGYGLYKSLGFEDAVSKYHDMKYVTGAGK
ncbi:MAG: GNAT family N-acetyltransferase [Ruminiclostridium sp.]|nr:GNAT family N-acetyltransferase [Ruminiclostridium sp.]